MIVFKKRNILMIIFRISLNFEIDKLQFVQNNYQ